MNIFLIFSSGLERAIPVAIMATLAMTSISLLKSSPTYSTVATVRPQAQYDYYLEHFSTAQINDTGKLKSFIRGRYAEHSEISNNTAVQDFLFASRNKNNIYLGQSTLADVNDNANDLTLKQNAIVNRISLKDSNGEVTSRLKSNHLRISQYPESVLSESAVQIEQGNRTITAKSMRYDGDMQEMNFQGAVKIRNLPKIN